MSKAKEMLALDLSELVDFDVLRENWHAYELEDDTIIRLKNVLMTILYKGPAESEESVAPNLGKYGFGVRILVVVNSPKNLRRSKGKELPVSELEKFIVKRNLKFRQIKDGGNSEYETKKAKITILNRVRQVDKTSKFDANWNPAYIIRTESQILIEPKGEQEKNKS